MSSKIRSLVTVTDAYPELQEALEQIPSTSRAGRIVALAYLGLLSISRSAGQAATPSLPGTPEIQSAMAPKAPDETVDRSAAEQPQLDNRRRSLMGKLSAD